MGCFCCFCSNHDEDPEVMEMTDTMKRQKRFGPIKSGRRCRDVIFLLLFIVFLGGMAAIAWRTIHTGNPLRIIYGTDSFGNICGLDNTGIQVANATGNPNVGLDLRNYSYVYYRNPQNLDLSFTICVQECPSMYIPSCTADVAGCQAAGVCYDTSPYNFTYPDIPDTDACPSYVYESKSYFRLTRCFPTVGETVAETAVASYFNNNTLIEQTLSDFVLGYYVFGYAVVATIVVAFIIVMLMRCFVKPIIYTCIILGLLATLGSSVVTTYYWKQLSDKLASEDPNARLDQEVRNERILFWAMIVFWVFTSIVWIIAIALRNRIRLSVVIFQKASKAIVRMPWMFVSPIITVIILGAFFAYWIAVYVYMTTSGDGIIIQGRIQYTESTDYVYMWWYHLFGLFWVWQFILACEELAIAGAVSEWFFAGKDVKMVSPFWTSVGRLIRYHLGSVAFGSLIIAIVMMIRFIFEYVNHKLNSNKGNPVIDFLIKCFRCCLWCLEKFLRFINKNAYIEIAIYGYSFCTAARQAFNTLFKNILRVGVLNLVTAFALFVCKLFIVGTMAVLAYFYINEWDPTLGENLHYWGPMVLVVCAIAFIVSDQFLNIVDMTVDTIFLCFAEDEARPDATDREAYMDKGLRKFIKRHNTVKEGKDTGGDDDDEE